MLPVQPCFFLIFIYERQQYSSMYNASVAVLRSIFSVDHNPGCWSTSLRFRTPEVPSRVQYQKIKPDCIAFHSCSTIFSIIEQDIRQCIQSRVYSRPMRSFLSWLHGTHQFPFPDSKFRGLLTIWFGFLIAETQYFLEQTCGVLVNEIHCVCLQKVCYVVFINYY